MNRNIEVVAQTVPTKVNVTVTIPNLIAALKAECGVYDAHERYYTVENGVLYKFTDTSYHGSPRYEKKAVTDDPNVVDMYQAVIAYEAAYKKTLKS